MKLISRVRCLVIWQNIPVVLFGVWFEGGCETGHAITFCIPGMQVN